MNMYTVLQSKMDFLLWVVAKNSHCFCPQGTELPGAYLNVIFWLLNFHSFQFSIFFLKREQSIWFTHCFQKIIFALEKLAF